MPESTNSQIAFSKVHTNPKKGYKLGTVSATWKKIKSAASNTKYNEAVADLESDTFETSNELNEEEESNLSSPPDKFMEYGPNGDLLVVYPQSEIVEIWDWKPLNTGSKSDGDTLYLLYQVQLAKSVGTIRNFTVLARADSYTTLILKQVDDHFLLETHSFNIMTKASRLLQVSGISSILHDQVDWKRTEFTFKKSEKFFLVGASTGYIYIYKIIHVNGVAHIAEGNADDELHTIRKKAFQQLVNKSLHSQLKPAEVVIQTSCNIDGTPIFDLVNGWLVYSPTKEEFKHLNAINSTKTVFAARSHLDPLITNKGGTSAEHQKGEYNKNVMKKNMLYTPVKLPPSGPLLNKVLSTFSNIAVDGMFRLSKISSSKVQAYFKSQNKSKDSSASSNGSVDKTLNSLGKSMGKLFYSTASTTATTLQNSTRHMKPNSNQLVKIIDLSNDKVLGLVKPPGGVSAVSLSPYDLHLVHATLRGDALYMWDLYRLPLEISLLGKFRRGKTSGIIKEIFWFINNFNEEQINSSNSIGGISSNSGTGNGSKQSDKSSEKKHKPTGNNSGFGCITKATGSIHWFNVNYLSGNSTDNYPKLFGSNSKSIDTLQFLDSWILPSFDAKAFVSLPLVQDGNKSTRQANQLAVIDGNNQLKLVSTLNGRHYYKYDLPVEPVNQEFVPQYDGNTVKNDCEDYDDVSQVNPLSQAEIETCSPFLNLVNNKNITFQTYLYGSDEETEFFEGFKEFGNVIPVKPLEFHQGKKDSKGTSQAKSLKDSSEELIIDQDLFNEILEE